MDVKRPQRKNRRRVKLAVYATLAVLAVALITYGLSRLKPAAPSVERGTVVTDTVKRGEMLLQVRGNGTLVPEEVRQIAAPVEGRVEQIFVKAGTEVSAGTVLVELSNPTLQQQAVDVQYQVKSAEADLNNLRARNDSDRMAQQAATAQVESEYNQAKIQLDTDEQLGKEGLVPLLTLRISRVKVEQLANRLVIEKKRLATAKESADAQIAAQQSRIEQLRAQLRLDQEHVASLQVRAGTNGVLQEVTVTVGQQITPGTNIARVADPSSLKAALQIPETQIKDVAVGQKASIDTRSGNGGVIEGRVERLDPAAHNGTFTVDVQLEGQLPPGARVDLSVDGTIELARLENVLYVGRPSSGGGAQANITLFKLEPDGHTAVRVPVRLGRASVSTVEVLDGLREGDTVILSDTQQWDGVDRIRID
ncbi:MAG: efflux RND transporter periplasmic adaptor subunit [Acidobacteriota bacterium]|nr:efflux RND transporter periplasmic adaptor subunit [Acidobacteriota bacterium]MDQ5835488.1 efflux RND transporter periplasmic adaptor subunit [Acidobacteriota bacterium]